jgi:glutamate-1-semialdehyde 2,1-aminomutase
MNAAQTSDAADRKARAALADAHAFIPGGVSSINRVIDPPIAFVKAKGAHLWDIDGNRFLDLHAAFAPYFLGHNFGPVNDAVVDVLKNDGSLFGAGPSVLEGQLAGLVCKHIRLVERMTLLNTGSEATSLAIRLSRAITGKAHFIVMQGGYNGNSDELACNVFNSIAEIGPRVRPGEYPPLPLGAGTTIQQTRFVHPINFNDLESVRYVCRRYPIAALITEPVLQNIGVVLPQRGYLEGLRDLADEFGFVLVFDEVKTGFRHALDGYSAIAGVRPDLVVYGKAVANGFPLAMVGGRRDYLDYIVHPDTSRRPLVSGTYNGHPVPVAAAIRTIEHLAANRQTLYPAVEALSMSLQNGLQQIFERQGVVATVVRQGSALSFYFMPNPPFDFHDMLENHNFELDVALRRALIRRGVFVMPVATKQLSLSCAHTAADVDFALEQFASALREACAGPARQP